MTFRITSLPLAPFQSLFALDDAALAALGARRMIADAPNSAPCRISLADAEPGEALILLNHRHLEDPSSPYRAEGPIFVREAALEARPAPGEVPDILGRRLLSVRAYDADWMMTDADVVEGRELGDRLMQWFADDRVDRIHVHTARRGCYLAEAERA
ncbi:hypothetical protein GCM10007859_14950 [Brevundimonas denitrificans]|uniref:DUF1203 domain-containing protein n=1 Tax=Brevundimonas denitrificans TaxID=1443434 RepID=A0ABQ6BHH2_9CAUL|nr:DUF1203 domain-containing protein [Brevundimonas denitrificans]GLS01480.1 hypothetical protein GCM10007859_14950 [Brevundimonas denitrificans]